MAKTLSTGVIFAIASAYGVAKTFSSLSNVSEAVASFAADPSLSAGDYIEVTSGWGRLNGRVVRVKSVSGSGPYLVTFESIDTTSTTRYPTGTGTGSVRKVTAWTNLSQIKDVAPSGGDLSFADVTDLEDVVERKMPTTRSASSLALTVYDDPSLAWYAPVQAASDSATPVGVKITYANGSINVGNAYWSLQSIPNVSKNEAMTTKVDMAYSAQPIRYAS